jgi:uncharacterized membrane protein
MERWTEEKMDRWIGFLLRTGVLLSAAIVGVGGIIYLVRHGATVVSYGTFHGEPPELRSIRGILNQAGTFTGRGLIQLGILLLIATPIARVAFSAIGFGFARDRLYVGLTLTVLAILAYGILGGPI